MEGQVTTAPINSKASLSIGNQVNALNRPLGFVVSASYNRSAAGYNDGDIKRYSYSGSVLTPDVIFNDAKGSDELTIGLMSTLNYKLAANHEIGATGMFSRSAESQTRLQVGTR